MDEPVPFITVVDSLFDNIRQQGQLTDDILRELNVLFPTVLIGALEILDKKNVTMLKASPSGRSMFIVKSSSGGRGAKRGAQQHHHHQHHHQEQVPTQNLATPPFTATAPTAATTSPSSSLSSILDGNVYKCLSLKFCTCQSFIFQIVNKRESIYCKHLLAIRLAQALNKYNVQTITDMDFATCALSVWIDGIEFR